MDTPKTGVCIDEAIILGYSAMETQLYALFPHILPLTLDLYLSLALVKAMQVSSTAAEKVGDCVIGHISLQPRCAGKAHTAQAGRLKATITKYFLLNSKK